MIDTIIQLSTGYTPYRMDDRGMYLNREMELMYRIIERIVLNALRLGHDADTTTRERTAAQEDAINYIKSDDFKIICDDIGLNIENILPLIFQRLGLGADEVKAYQMELAVEA